MKITTFTLLLLLPSFAYSQTPTEYAHLAIAQQIAKKTVNDFKRTPTESVSTKTSISTNKSTTSKETQVKNVKASNNADCAAVVECANLVPTQQVACGTNTLQRRYNQQASCAKGSSTSSMSSMNCGAQPNCASSFQEMNCGTAQQATPLRRGFFRRLLNR